MAYSITRKNGAAFLWGIHNHEPRAIVLVDMDLDRCMSVTNDIENVVKQLESEGAPIDELPVVYRDSDHLWTQIVIENKTFIKFMHLEATLDEVLEKVSPTPQAA